MLRSKVIAVFLLVLLLSFTSKDEGYSAAFIKSAGYLMEAAPNEASQFWTAYAFKHLMNRTKEQGIVLLQNGRDESGHSAPFLKIYFTVSAHNNWDYGVHFEKNVLTLSAKDDQTALWLCYQLIESIGAVDGRFSVADLPPAIIDLTQNINADFDFDYREPFFPYNLQSGFSGILGTNNIDLDWGLWGHNIKKHLDDTGDPGLYALVDGKRDRSQFCFSSPGLFQQLSAYISDNYGDGSKHSYNFMILPADNGLVCTDQKCLDAGNTKVNASPAVAGLIHKLAKRFPKNRFYTTAYRTTLQAPTKRMPENSGVFISTIDLAKGVPLNENQPATKSFLDLCASWKKATPNIYIWDYAANFDDYLSPVPILLGFQSQLQFFKKIGIKGVFLEGSDYDYSSFEDLKTYVAAALLMNVHADVDSLCQRFFQQQYPTSHKLLYHYYRSLEKEFKAKDIPFDLYGGTKGALNTYLNVSNFIHFYGQLEQAILNAKAEEKERLKKLYTALSFTRLQIAYFNGFGPLGYARINGDKIFVNPEVESWLENLEAFSGYKDMQQYRESDGSLAAYCQFWKKLLSERELNQLYGAKIAILTKENSSANHIELLNNGIPGFPQDYHQGWFITKSGVHLKIPVSQFNGTKLIRMNFLIDPAHGFEAPDRVEFVLDGKLVKTINGGDFTEMKNEAGCQMKANFSHNQSLELHFYIKQGAKSKLACDEIQLINA